MAFEFQILFYMLIYLKILVHILGINLNTCNLMLWYSLILSRRTTFLFSENLHSSQLLFYKVHRITASLAIFRFLPLVLKQNKTIQYFPFKNCIKEKDLETSLIWINSWRLIRISKKCKSKRYMFKSVVSFKEM